ncbi:MAG: CHASE2 domain-containing protein [Hydrogenophaga sp.]|uniref:CHASE2 domain-containing protein n=1 Tax=Hydrogenophaga sp. TaxID=1904254 RepID=UPI003D0C0A3B
MDSHPSDPVSSFFQDPVRRRRPTRWLEWCLLSALLLSGVAALSALRSLERIDLVINDQLGRLNSPPVSSDVIIVAIDDKSLEAIGRWPWRRAIHAAALNRIAAAQPRAVGLDLILVERDPVVAGDDRLLGEAIARAGQVVLPLVLQDIQGDGRLLHTVPVPALAAAAAGLGHIHLEIDSDGIVRSTFLREGDGTQWWDHLALAVLRTGGFDVPQPLPGQRPSDPTEPTAWQRDHWIQIPFAGPPGSFERVSYVDVLKGQVSAERLAGKFVLVGATAAGMGDAYATPRSGMAELMPGVEIAANVMNALLLDQRLQRASAWQNAVFCVLPVALALLAVVVLPPTAGLLASASLLAATLGAAWLGAALAGLQFAPAAGLLGVLLAYPLWVWRRLRTAIGYLLEEFQRMEARRDLPTMLPASRSGDLLDRHIHALQDASEQLRNLHRFVSETLNSVPDATLVTDTSGQVLMANQSARRYFAARQVNRLRGRFLDDLLRYVQRTDTRQPIFDTRDRLRQDNLPWGAEARDADGRDLLVRFVPCFNTEGRTTSWITSLVDITPIREAERQRDVALRFISHDMRSPQSSILALLEVQRMNPQATVSTDMLERIERHAHRTLDLAEEFVQLARAESSTYRMETVDLVDLLDEAVDDVWPQAQARHVVFQVQRPDTPALCEADRGLLTRAIANLLVNAVKYGHQNASVHCAVQRLDTGWRLSIANEGAGLQPEQLQSLFQQFARLDPDQSATRGVGLGLVFVRTVVERHGGRVDVTSSPGQGTTFHFTLPRIPA